MRKGYSLKGLPAQIQGDRTASRGSARHVVTYVGLKLWFQQTHPGVSGALPRTLRSSAQLPLKGGTEGPGA